MFMQNKNKIKRNWQRQNYLKRKAKRAEKRRKKRK